MDDELKAWLKEQLRHYDLYTNKSARGKVSLIKEILVLFG